MVSSCLSPYCGIIPGGYAHFGHKYPPQNYSDIFSEMGYLVELIILCDGGFQSSYLPHVHRTLWRGWTIVPAGEISPLR